MTKIDTLYTVGEDGKVRLHLHPGQAKVWRSNARFILMLAGTQGGKTSFGPWWLWREIEKMGGGDYLAVTTTFPLFLLKMLPEMRRVFCDILQIGKYWGGTGVIEIRDPVRGFIAKSATDDMYARIILRSVGSPAGLEAATAKAAWLDECGQDGWGVEAWEAVQRRLSIHEGRVLGTTTVYNRGFIKFAWYDLWKKGDPDYDVIQFASVINPTFPKKEFLRARRTLPGWRFLMFYMGMFSRPAGLIYHDFDDTKMVVDPIVIPPTWKHVVGVDFGGANMAFIWLAMDPDDGMWYYYDESVEGNMATAEHARKARIKAAGCIDIQFVGGSWGETQDRRDFNVNKLPMRGPAVAGVEEGISKVIELIKDNRLRVFGTASGILHELATYKRKLDESGQSLNDIQDKATFHRLDALRYAVSIIMSSGFWSRSGR